MENAHLYRYKPIECQKKTQINLHNLELGLGFLDMIPKAQETKENINWSASKLKTFVLQMVLSISEKTTHRIG